MQNFRNYFELLEVSPAASAADIKQAYRQMARRYHPDLNPGNKAAEERFKLLREAYEVLSDPEKRTQYEAYSRFWQPKGFGGKGNAGGRFNLGKMDFSELGDFNRFVDQLLNRRDRPQPPPQPAPDYRPNPEPRRHPPRPSAVYGASTAATAAAAPAAARSARRDAEAHLTVPLERAYAGGQERVRLEDGRSLEVNMPAGMVTGQRIRLKGQGIGGGNLYLRIEVEPHPFFTVDGNDIFCQVPITPSEAALGGTIEVPTLDGPVRMTVPAGVQSGKRLRLAHKGYPLSSDRQGDQIVELQVVVPTTLSDRERALYAELHELSRFTPRADLPV
ncbi:MAG: J domain-containing protein [Leptolyngbya sp. RL_3_1]|nr:J domain-containing protein [Leptolyngbya sp. RL_3_1]